ncbi:MAG: SprT family zinc-dependent metalloprotease [Bacteroidales bacterium]|nr:M48 family metallopeptidase [Lentimicrobiaceae bacterium]MDD5694781.1 SprT family zinc-dependent metalloprotease [Bacteroidales bacterium]
MKLPISRIIRSRRRTIALIITPDAQLIVRAPLHTTMAEIEKLVEQKRNWITKKLLQVQQKQDIRRMNPFRDGELFRYKGNQYPLLITSSERSIHLNENHILFPERFLVNPERAMIYWYAHEALRTLSQRVRYYTEIQGFRHTGITVTGARTRWGSCNQANRLCFSWRLILTPEFVIDYVVVHELCHTVEKNHSARFWNRVGAILPDYKERKALLKEY